MIPHKKRYLIVGTGRSGSSLLCAILANAGANFDMGTRQSWDRKSGTYEHPRLHAAFRWLYRPKQLGSKRITRKHLTALLENAEFAKSSNLIWLVQRIHQLEYQPVIIASYRKFEDYCVSRYLRFGWDVSRMVEYYTKIYRTTLLQLAIFGGCAISYEEMIDPAETDWSLALSELTGIDHRQLLESRDKLAKKTPSRLKIALPVWDERAEAIYDELYRYKGQVIGSKNHQLVLQK